LTDGSPTLTVVVPVFNEQESLPEFHRRLSTVLDGLPFASEILFVDDGSRDGSRSLLAAMRRDDPRVRVISLSRNFGHQIAVSAGLDEARGEAVVVIDSDLQDPPELIPELVAKWREGYEVVHAVRTARRGETRFKRWTASAFYRLIRSWTDLNIQLDAGDFRLMGRQAVDALRSMPEQFRFVRGMTAWVGFEQTGVPYERDSRFAGDSKYPLRRMVRLAMTAITSFSFVPLQLASVFGFIVSGLAALAVPIVVALRLLGAEGLGGQTTVLLAVLFFGGVQLLFLGVLGEYLGRISVEVKRRPLYFVDRAEHRAAPEPGENP
jgi:dolichol-phosphate mannosyltransferase